MSRLVRGIEIAPKGTYMDEVDARETASLKAILQFIRGGSKQVGVGTFGSWGCQS